MNPVIIAAAKFEIEPLVAELKQHGHSPEFGLVGIGAINAAKNARVTADFCRNRDVIFVGTCGSFVPFDGVKLIRATKVFWSPTGERVGLAYTVRDTAPPISLPDPPIWATQLDTRQVLCSPTISLTNHLSPNLPAEALVENLELYSCISDIAEVCATLAVILAITNQVGPDSHAQWRQYFSIAASRTAEFIAGNIK